MSKDRLISGAVAARLDATRDGVAELRELLETGEAQEWTSARIRRECAEVWRGWPGARQELGRGFVEGWLAKNEALFVAGCAAR